MTVRRQGSAIVLEGRCSVDEAEMLALLLRDAGAATVDWRGASHLHTALVQLVLQAGRPVQGPCGDPFVARWIEPITVAAPPGGL
ncbi:hypothetical protein [Rubellimicrobium arenae]|uniref:hypothetical protein n=1 Tax=Rubellimicrobium arenae TaxID=2817372 RepID=UPI001B30DAFA|nr:hypothetical protein [Rubellimicrobium arenae]